MENLKKSSYEEWLFYYQVNNLGWDQLAKHQQLVLIRMYKRKLQINVISFDESFDKIIAHDIKKDLNLNLDCSDIEAKKLTNCIRYRLAM